MLQFLTKKDILLLIDIVQIWGDFNIEFNDEMRLRTVKRFIVNSEL